MVKSIPSSNKKVVPDSSSDIPPQIPPRMKKKGPALPEKPPHIRAKSSPNPSSQQLIREPLKPRTLTTNIDVRQPTQREVLVAASRAVREKPVEKRQREPAKLLMPTFADGNSGGTILRKDIVIVPSKKTSFLDDQILLPSLSGRKEIAVLPSKSVDDQVLVASRKEYVLVPSKIDDRLVLPIKKGDSSKNRKSRQQHGPVLLIPRAPMSWGPPVSFALWSQRDPGKGIRREPTRPAPVDKQTNSNSRSGSVTRSGSLTSQGSSSSDSGNETFPKSVLKKQKRIMPNTTSKGTSGSSKKLEQKKNVTFNAFATVQLMEE